MKHRILKEEDSKVELVIAKALARAPLHPSEIEELSHKTMSDLMIDHDLDSSLAERVMNHIKLESQRQTYQSHQTWEVESRKPQGGYKRTYPLRESSEPTIKKILEGDYMPEDITDLDTENHHPETSQKDSGRMLDYGHVKSDSREGKMMRQALYEMSEYSAKLHDMLDDDDDLPQWCHYKIAVARACVGKVRHYLEYKIKKKTGEIQ